MAQLYSSLDIVILTSLNEGTPVVLIEAMASGKLFIVTELGGSRFNGWGWATCVGKNERPVHRTSSPYMIMAFWCRPKMFMD